MLVKHLKSNGVPIGYHHPEFIPGHVYRILDNREEQYNLFLCVHTVAGGPFCNRLYSIVTGTHIFKDSQRWEDVTDYYECTQISRGNR
jgi:hypothetical protein